MKPWHPSLMGTSIEDGSILGLLSGFEGCRVLGGVP